MKATSVASRRHLATTRKPRALDLIARRLVLARLGQLQLGHIIIEDGDDTWCFGEAADGAELLTTIVVRDA
ncbi:MAG: hypothetical protein PVF46_07460, partial [Lysobacterales bacterium]